MTVVDLKKDTTNHTMTIVSEYPASPERVWELWADPRLLERWWGPPTYPATVTDHELSPGGSVRYFMTGPEGDRYHGAWRVNEVEAPHRIEVEDVFVNDDGTVNADMPVSRMSVAIEDAGEGTTRMTITSRFASLEAMQQLVEMGMEEGIRQALGQTDALLAAQPA